MKTFASLFTGGDGAGIGAKSAGLEPIWGLEIDPKIAAIAEQNLGHKVYCQDILDSDPSNFDSPDWLHASPVCFPAGTLILTNKGLISIELIKKGDFVLTHKGNFQRVSQVLTRESSVISLKGQGHHGLIVTPDHPFLSSKKVTRYPPQKERRAGNWSFKEIQSPKWVSADNLLGKHWLSLTEYPSMEIPQLTFLGNESLRGQTFDLDANFFRIVGCWVGNGWVRYSEGSDHKKNRGVVSISCDRKKEDLMEQFLLSAKIKFIKTEKRTAINFEIFSRPLCRWLVDNFGKLADGKEIPVWLLGAPKAIRESFFEGYLFTDGTIQKSSHFKCRTSTISKKLAYGMRMIGLSLGYSVSILLHIPPAKGVIEGRVINQSPIYYVSYSSVSNSSFCVDSYRSGLVKKIIPLDQPQKVFCLTVENDESYVADGIIVHNCKAFSNANANKGEKDWDVKCGHKVAEFIEVLQPQYFSLENVRAYRDSRAFQIIVEALNANGYNCSTEVINAADYGVPQSRERLFLVAYKGDLRWFWTPFTSNAKRMGWYEAIADLLPSLPDSKLADWQIKALPSEIRDHLLLNVRANQNSVIGIDPKECNQPSFTVPATLSREIPKALLIHPTDHRTMPLIDGLNPAFTTTTNKGGNSTKALLIESTGARSDLPLQTGDHDKPCWTIRAMGQGGHYHKAHVLERAKIKQLDIPCLARLQGFPDDYKWSGHKATDGTIIGNSVCPPVMKALIENTINWGK